MLTVVNVTNPFEAIATQDAERWEAPDGFSVRQAIRLKEPDFVEFRYPTICKVNNEAWKRERWDEPLPDDAEVLFIRLAGDPVTLVIAVVALVVAVAVLVFYKPKKPKLIKPPEPLAIGAFAGAAVHAASANHANQNGDPVYSLSGERNQSRVNNVIECAYGRNRLFPAYAATPYNVYAGNLQYQFSLFCLGHGSFTVEEMRFEDTPLSSFPDVEFEIVDPGEPFELFADNVETSAEVSNIELFGSNEPEYTGWTSGYVANAPFTKTNRLEIDLSLPSGLYTMHPTTGAMQALGVSAAFEYMELNDYGAQVGSWKPLKFQLVEIVPALKGETIKKTKYSKTTYDFFSKTLATATPQRYTLSAEVPLGRYQVRGMRRGAKNRSLQAADLLKWETLRAFMPNVRNYGDITLIAMKVRATNNLNNNAAAKFNCIATRKLPTWSAQGGWSAPVTTRSTVWAFCDAFRAKYGGRMETEFLDMVELAALNETFETSKTYFDYIFDQKTTVWEVAKAIARVARCIPVLQGSRITMVRDAPQAFAKAVFNAYNMVKDSFSWHIRMNTVANYDGVEVEYVDEETWKLETVLCLIDDDAGDFPEPLRLTGCTSRQRAYSEGLYARALQKYSKETITFKTGIEGHLPRYGDLIRISHDVPRWGTGGQVSSIDGQHLYLTEPVQFQPGVVHKMVLRKKDGSAHGPFTVTAGTSPFDVVAAEPIGASFYFDDTHERPLFLFGVENLESRQCLVAGIKPESKDVIQIESIPYDPRVYSFGSFVAPPRNAGPVNIVEPSRPVVTELRVTIIPGTNEHVTVSWSPALGAKNYVVESSPNGIDWQRATTLPSTIYILRVVPGTLYVRVAGVNVDFGPWATWNGRVGAAITKPGTVAGLRLLTLVPGTASVTWNAMAAADQFEISVYATTTGRFLRRKTQDAVTVDYSYTQENAVVDGLTDRAITIRVKGQNIAGLSDTPASISLIIPDFNPEVEATDASSTTFSSDNTDVQSDAT